MIRPIAIDDCETVFTDSEPADELLALRLKKSLKAPCSHMRRECVSTSSTGWDTAWVKYVCLDCSRGWTEEMTNAEYEHFIKSYKEPAK